MLEHRMDRKQRERILKEYLKNMSIRAILRVKCKAFTIAYRRGLE
ncbi:hypothetical protein [Sulfolobus sp. E11-6]|nr:hypothetical protein [Sulfolobus sp. E11-6]